MIRAHVQTKGVVKATALLVALSFVLPLAGFAFAPGTYPADPVGAYGFTPFKVNGQTIKISPQWGMITSSHQSQGNKTVVYIQNLHCNYEVQQNIYHMLKGLVARNGLSLIGIEGESKPVDPSPIASIPEQDIKTKVSDYFMRRGRLTGADYLAATGKKPVVLAGIENQKLYDYSKKKLLEFLTDENQGYVEDLRHALERLKAPLYNLSLAKLDHKKEQFDYEQIPLENYTDYLLVEAHRLNISYDAFPGLAAYAVHRQMPYQGDVDYERLRDDVRAFDQRLRTGMYTSRDQRQLDYYLNLVRIMGNMINISATDQDIRYYRQHTDEFSPARILTFLDKTSFHYAVDLQLDGNLINLGKALPLAAEFYQASDKRSDVFIHNLLRQMNKRDQNFAVLITGGFHASEVEKAMARQGITYVAIKPRITRTDVANPYYNLLKGRLTPIEKLLKQHENLFELRDFFTIPLLASHYKNLVEQILEVRKKLSAGRFNVGKAALSYSEEWSMPEKHLYVLRFRQGGVLDRNLAVIVRPGESSPGSYDSYYAEEKLDAQGTMFQIVNIAALENPATRAAILGPEVKGQQQSLTPSHVWVLFSHVAQYLGHPDEILSQLVSGRLEKKAAREEQALAKQQQAREAAGARAQKVPMGMRARAWFNRMIHNARAALMENSLELFFLSTLLTIGAAIAAVFMPVVAGFVLAAGSLAMLISSYIAVARGETPVIIQAVAGLTILMVMGTLSGLFGISALAYSSSWYIGILGTGLIGGSLFQDYYKGESAWSKRLRTTLKSMGGFFSRNKARIKFSAFGVLGLLVLAGLAPSLSGMVSVNGLLMISGTFLIGVLLRYYFSKRHPQAGVVLAGAVTAMLILLLVGYHTGGMISLVQAASAVPGPGTAELGAVMRASQAPVFGGAYSMVGLIGFVASDYFQIISSLWEETSQESQSAKSEKEPLPNKEISNEDLIRQALTYARGTLNLGTNQNLRDYTLEQHLRDILKLGEKVQAVSSFINHDSVRLAMAGIAWQNGSDPMTQGTPEDHLLALANNFTEDENLARQITGGAALDSLTPQQNGPLAQFIRYLKNATPEDKTFILGQNDPLNPAALLPSYFTKEVIQAIKQLKDSHPGKELVFPASDMQFLAPRATFKQTRQFYKQQIAVAAELGANTVRMPLEAQNQESQWAAMAQRGQLQVSFSPVESRWDARLEEDQRQLISSLLNHPRRINDFLTGTAGGSGLAYIKEVRLVSASPDQTVIRVTGGDERYQPQAVELRLITGGGKNLSLAQAETRRFQGLDRRLDRSDLGRSISQIKPIIASLPKAVQPQARQAAQRQKVVAVVFSLPSVGTRLDQVEQAQKPQAVETAAAFLAGLWESTKSGPKRAETGFVPDRIQADHLFYDERGQTAAPDGLKLGRSVESSLLIRRLLVPNSLLRTGMSMDDAAYSHAVLNGLLSQWGTQAFSTRLAAYQSKLANERQRMAFRQSLEQWAADHPVGHQLRNQLEAADLISKETRQAAGVTKPETGSKTMAAVPGASQKPGAANPESAAAEEPVAEAAAQPNAVEIPATENQSTRNHSPPISEEQTAKPATSPEKARIIATVKRELVERLKPVLERKWAGLPADRANHLDPIIRHVENQIQREFNRLQTVLDGGTTYARFEIYNRFIEAFDENLTIPPVVLDQLRGSPKRQGKIEELNAVIAAFEQSVKAMMKTMGQLQQMVEHNHLTKLGQEATALIPSIRELSKKMEDIKEMIITAQNAEGFQSYQDLVAESDKLITEFRKTLTGQRSALENLNERVDKAVDEVIAARAAQERQERINRSVAFASTELRFSGIDGLYMRQAADEVLKLELAEGMDDDEALWTMINPDNTEEADQALALAAVAYTQGWLSEKDPAKRQAAAANRVMAMAKDYKEAEQLADEVLDAQKLDDLISNTTPEGNADLARMIRAIKQQQKAFAIGLLNPDGTLFYPEYALMHARSSLTKRQMQAMAKLSQHFKLPVAIPLLRPTAAQGFDIQNQIFGLHQAQMDTASQLGSTALVVYPEALEVFDAMTNKAAYEAEARKAGTTIVSLNYNPRFIGHQTQASQGELTGEHGFYGAATEKALKQLMQFFLNSNDPIAMALKRSFGIFYVDAQLAARVVLQGFREMSFEQMEAFFAFFGHNARTMENKEAFARLEIGLNNLAQSLKGEGKYESLVERAQNMFANLQAGRKLRVVLYGNASEIKGLQVRQLTPQMDVDINRLFKEHADQLGGFFQVQGDQGIINVMDENKLDEIIIHEFLENIVGIDHADVEKMLTLSANNDVVSVEGLDVDEVVFSKEKMARLFGVAYTQSQSSKKSKKITGVTIEEKIKDFESSDPRLVETKETRQATKLKTGKVRNVTALNHYNIRKKHDTAATRVFSNTFDLADGSIAYRVATNERVTVTIPKGQAVVMGSKDFSSCLAYVIRGVNGQGDTVLDFDHLAAANDDRPIDQLRTNIDELRSQGIGQLQLFVQIDPKAMGMTDNDRWPKNYYTFPRTWNDVQQQVGDDVEILAIDHRLQVGKNISEFANIYVTDESIAVTYPHISKVQPEVIQWAQGSVSKRFIPVDRLRGDPVKTFDVLKARYIASPNDHARPLSIDYDNQGKVKGFWMENKPDQGALTGIPSKDTPLATKDIEIPLREFLQKILVDVSQNQGFNHVAGIRDGTGLLFNRTLKFSPQRQTELNHLLRDFQTEPKQEHLRDILNILIEQNPARMVAEVNRILKLYSFNFAYQQAQAALSQTLRERLFTPEGTPQFALYLSDSMVRPGEPNFASDYDDAWVAPSDLIQSVRAFAQDITDVLVNELGLSSGLESLVIDIPRAESLLKEGFSGFSNLFYFAQLWAGDFKVASIFDSLRAQIIANEDYREYTRDEYNDSLTLTTSALPEEVLPLFHRIKNKVVEVIGQRINSWDEIVVILLRRGLINRDEARYLLGTYQFFVEQRLRASLGRPLSPSDQYNRYLEGTLRIARRLYPILTESSAANRKAWLVSIRRSTEQQARQARPVASAGYLALKAIQNKWQPEWLTNKIVNRFGMLWGAAEASLGPLLFFHLLAPSPTLIWFLFALALVHFPLDRANGLVGGSFWNHFGMQVAIILGYGALALSGAEPLLLALSAFHIGLDYRNIFRPTMRNNISVILNAFSRPLAVVAMGLGTLGLLLTITQVISITAIPVVLIAAAAAMTWAMTMIVRQSQSRRTAQTAQETEAARPTAKADGIVGLIQLDNKLGVKVQPAGAFSALDELRSNWSQNKISIFFNRLFRIPFGMRLIRVLPQTPFGRLVNTAVMASWWAGLAYMMAGLFSGEAAIWFISSAMMANAPGAYLRMRLHNDPAYSSNLIKHLLAQTRVDQAFDQLENQGLNDKVIEQSLRYLTRVVLEEANLSLDQETLPGESVQIAKEQVLAILSEMPLAKQDVSINNKVYHLPVAVTEGRLLLLLNQLVGPVFYKNGIEIKPILRKRRPHGVFSSA